MKTRPRRTMRDRLLSWGLVFLAVVVLPVTALTLNRMRLKREVQARIAAIRAQGLPTTLEELDAWYPFPVEGPNAADVYLEAFARMPEVSDEEKRLITGAREFTTNLLSRTLPIPPEYIDRVEPILARHRESMDLLHQGAAISPCRFPTQRSRVDIGLTCELDVPVQLSRVLSLHALLRAEKGDVEGAIGAISDQLALGAQFQKIPMVVHSLIGRASIEISLFRLPRILSRAVWTDEQLVRMARTIRQTENSDSLFRSLAGEQPSMLNSLRPDSSFMLYAASLGAGVPEWVERAVLGLTEILGLRELNTVTFLELHGQAIQACRQPFPAALASFEDLDASLEDLPFYMYMAREMGPWGSYVGRHAVTLAHRRNAYAALAAERFRLARGRWPETLDELVPAYLDAVPEDPFDGKPLRYRRRPDGFTVYSIGENGRDDGGDETRVGASMKDIPFTVEKAGAGPAGFRPQTD